MPFHYVVQLHSFGNEYEGVRKNCLKQIAFFEQLQEDEFEKEFGSLVSDDDRR